MLSGFKIVKCVSFSVLLGRAVGDWDHVTSVTFHKKKEFDLLIMWLKCKIVRKRYSLFSIKCCNRWIYFQCL